MLTEGLLSNLFEGDVVPPKAEPWAGRVDSFAGSLSFSLTFDLGAQDESPSSQYVTLAFILGSPSRVGSAIDAVVGTFDASFWLAAAELAAGKARVSGGGSRSEPAADPLPFLGCPRGPRRGVERAWTSLRRARNPRCGRSGRVRASA